MSWLPPVPPWEGLHPLVIHFPIALLFIVPLFVLFGMFAPRHAPAWRLAGLLTLALGTVAAFVATATGEASAEIAERTAAAHAVLERHEEMGEFVRNLFAGLTVVYAALIVVTQVVRAKWMPAASLWGASVFLLVYLGSLVALANAAHEGGRLVHEFGVRAPTATLPEASMSDREHHDD
ncbi:MAG TPA: DUF2231 domain-containing protein [Gemmatimonadaceae bacterium]|nr:DUF2231 domain-containing protein [Gemmatimonadaceae bacterium]